MPKSSAQTSPHSWGQRLTNKISAKGLLHWVVLIAITLYLIHKLSLIGWADIWQSRPTSPLFYILSLAIMFLPIIADKITFDILTARRMILPLKIFIRKLALNKAVLTYSGEAYMAQQLSQIHKVKLKKAAIVIKDQTLVRTFVANLWVIILVLAALVFGNAGILQKIALISPALLISVNLICILVCAGALFFYHKLTTITFTLAAKIASVFLLRSFLVSVTLMAQWSLAMPVTALSVWFIFLVVFSLTRKSPVGGELVFVSVALTLPGLEQNSAQVAAMLVTLLALNQTNYFIAFLLTSDFNPKTIFKQASKPNAPHQNPKVI